MRLKVLLTLVAGALSAALLLAIGNAVEAASSGSGGAADPTVLLLRARGVHADPAPGIFAECGLPLVGRLPACPIDRTAAMAAAGRFSGAQSQSAELVSMDLPAGRTLAWAVTVRGVLTVAAMCPMPAPGGPTCRAPGPATWTGIVLVDGRSGGFVDCSSLSSAPTTTAQSPSSVVLMCRYSHDMRGVKSYTTSSGSSRTGPWSPRATNALVSAARPPLTATTT